MAFDLGKQLSEIAPGDPKIFEGDRSEDDLYQLARHLIRSGMNAEKVFDYLRFCSSNCSPAIEDDEVLDRIDQMVKKSRERGRNIAEEVREWVLAASGYFLTSDIHRDLNLAAKDHKKSVNMALLRLEKEGILEKRGERRGSYRRIEKEDDDIMGFIEEEIFEYPIKLPFGLNDLCKLFPKNIIIVAGSKNAGKTALLLNIAKLNAGIHEVEYLNSEMGKEEWSTRLKIMGYNKKSDINFLARQCHTNFHDKMDGKKKIYIVDYLEIHDNFYEIAKPIRMIHEKIEDGVCIIAVQKKRGEMFGRGGEFSQEKSRLYLTMEYQPEMLCSSLTIASGKNLKISESVDGWSKRIKITGGGEMHALDKQWRLS